MNKPEFDFEIALRSWITGFAVAKIVALTGGGGIGEAELLAIGGVIGGLYDLTAFWVKSWLRAQKPSR